MAIFVRYLRPNPPFASWVSIKAGTWNISEDPGIKVLSMKKIKLNNNKIIFVNYFIVTK